MDKAPQAGAPSHIPPVAANETQEDPLPLEGAAGVSNSDEQPQTSSADEQVPSESGASSRGAKIGWGQIRSWLSPPKAPDKKTVELINLVAAASNNKPFLIKEGIFRLSPSATEKTAALADIPTYLAKLEKEKEEDINVILLASVIKQDLCNILTRKEKKEIALLTGVTKSEWKARKITQNRITELENTLLADDSKFDEFPTKLGSVVALAQLVREDYLVNKMTSTNLAICIAPNVTPKVGEETVDILFENTITKLISAMLTRAINPNNLPDELPPDPQAVLFTPESSSETHTEQPQPDEPLGAVGGVIAETSEWDITTAVRSIQFTEPKAHEEEDAS